jgi:hypothetical protein
MTRIPQRFACSVEQPLEEWIERGYFVCRDPKPVRIKTLIEAPHVATAIGKATIGCR